MSSWEYQGGGYFRQKGVPRGKIAPIIHAPELVDQLEKEQIETIRVIRAIVNVENTYREGGKTPLEYCKAEASALLEILTGESQ